MIHSKLISTGNQLVKSNSALLLRENQDSSSSSLSNRPRFDLKLWQIALLFGIPTATLISYFLYRRYFNDNNKSIQSKPEITKEEEEETKVEKPQVQKVKFKILLNFKFRNKINN